MVMVAVIPPSAFRVQFRMETVRIGCVKYLNTLPMIEGLEAWREAELVPAVPSKLIGMLLGREVDVAICSVVDAADPAVCLLPVGMIGCDGPTRTVRVFSRVPFDKVTRLHADTDSHTSVVLAQVILRHAYGRSVEVTGFEAGTGAAGHGPWPETVLLIGDKVETDPPREADGFVHQLDLGAAWKELTGLPFVYAVWMCRDGEERTPGVAMAASVLTRSRLHNRTRLDWLVQSHATERGWSVEHAGEYLGHLLRFEVGEREREAVARFIAMAHSMGLVKRGEVRWADETKVSEVGANRHA